jgi:hypothetical protein
MVIQDFRSPRPTDPAPSYFQGPLNCFLVKQWRCSRCAVFMMKRLYNSDRIGARTQ